MSLSRQVNSGPLTGKNCESHSDNDSDSSTSEYEPLDVTKDDGWEDVEPEEENEQIVSLFSAQLFPDVQSMLRDCKENHAFDFASVQKELGV